MSASEQADEYLQDRNLSYGWNSNRRMLVTSGAYVIDGDVKGDKFETVRDAAFFEAFKQAMIKQCKLCRATVAVKDSQSIESMKIDALELGDVVKGEWKTELENYTYRCHSIIESGTDIASFSEIDKLELVNVSVLSMTVQGYVNGLVGLEFFESYEDSGIGEVCVLIISEPKIGEDSGAESFMRGDASFGVAGHESFEDWMAQQDVESMVGVQRCFDDEGNQWIVGCAPIINGDRDTAFKKARFWASFAFGSEVLSITKSVEGYQGRSLRSIDIVKEMLSTKNGVLGTVFPEGFVQKREISGRRIRTGKPCKIMLCVLPPGATKYQDEQAKRLVEYDVKRQYILGKLDSLKVARKVFVERIATLTSKTDKDGRKRRELEKALKEITATINDLESLLKN